MKNKTELKWRNCKTSIVLGANNTPQLSQATSGFYRKGCSEQASLHVACSEDLLLHLTTGMRNPQENEVTVVKNRISGSLVGFSYFGKTFGRDLYNEKSDQEEIK